MRVRRSKLGGWTTTPADRIALLRTCLRLRSLRAPCGEKENNNQKWSHYLPETKSDPAKVVHEFETKASRRSLSNAKSLRSEVGLLAADKTSPFGNPKCECPNNVLTEAFEKPARLFP